MISLGPDIPDDARSWRNDLRVRRWCRQYTLITQDDHEAWLHRLANDASIKMFSIWNDLQAVGVCGLTSIDHVNQRAEFSLYIAPAFQGKNYGEQALRQLIKHGFEDLNLQRIWGEVFDGNPAMKMFQKVGFQLEGILRRSYFREGKWIDSHIVSVLREGKC